MKKYETELKLEVVQSFLVGTASPSTFAALASFRENEGLHSIAHIRHARPQPMLLAYGVGQAMREQAFGKRLAGSCGHADRIFIA